MYPERENLPELDNVNQELSPEEDMLPNPRDKDGVEQNYNPELNQDNDIHQAGDGVTNSLAGPENDSTIPSRQIPVLDIPVATQPQKGCTGTYINSSGEDVTQVKWITLG